MKCETKEDTKFGVGQLKTWHGNSTESLKFVNLGCTVPYNEHAVWQDDTCVVHRPLEYLETSFVFCNLFLVKKKISK